MMVGITGCSPKNSGRYIIHRERESDLDIEYDENQCNQIKARVEVEPPPPDRPLPAFVDGRFEWVWQAWGHQTAHQQRHTDERKSNEEENEDGSESEMHGGFHVGRSARLSNPMWRAATLARWLAAQNT